MKHVTLLICCFFSISIQAKLKVNSTSCRRNKILEDELKMSIGGRIILDHKENLVNEVLMQWKIQELDQGFDNPHKFMFSRSYFEYKDDIKNSRVYQFIKTMPKGAALHIHASAMLSPDYLLNITYKDHLYVCLGKILMFKFSYTVPENECGTHWNLISDVRKSLDNVTRFDLELRNNFTIPGIGKLDANAVWECFGNIFKSISNLWNYRPVWEEYMYEIMKQSRNDKAMYIEIRSFLPQLYELDGKHHNELFFTNITNRVVEQFVGDYPDFLGAKMICSFGRRNDPKTVEDLLSMTKESKRFFPDFVAGFDLIGREDKGRPLLDFLPQLEAAKADLNYYFHAGETNWYGTTDQNLIDAVLLGTKRIGHAYALLKHPLVLEKVKKRKIGLEVNLVSNNVLGFVGDMRNHPLASFISQDLPVVLSSDDPGVWEADPLSTDFYVAFMGVASRAHDLRLLKQLALNSIQYSSLNDAKKETAFKMFGTEWNRFIDSVFQVITDGHGSQQNVKMVISGEA